MQQYETRDACNAPAAVREYRGNCYYEGFGPQTAAIERPVGVNLSLEELSASITDLESAFKALDARLVGVALSVPQNGQSGPQPVPGHDRSPIAQNIAAERARISMIALCVRQTLATLDV
jgi:hypothetical protein